jgi:hypothetical protein
MHLLKLSSRISSAGGVGFFARNVPAPFDPALRKHLVRNCLIPPTLVLASVFSVRVSRALSDRIQYSARYTSKTRMGRNRIRHVVEDFCPASGSWQASHHLPFFRLDTRAMSHGQVVFHLSSPSQSKTTGSLHDYASLLLIL